MSSGFVIEFYFAVDAEAVGGPEASVEQERFRVLVERVPSRGERRLPMPTRKIGNSSSPLPSPGSRPGPSTWSTRTASNEHVCPSCGATQTYTVSRGCEP